MSPATARPEHNNRAYLWEIRLAIRTVTVLRAGVICRIGTQVQSHEALKDTGCTDRVGAAERSEAVGHL